jgi:hypothetical protein
MLSDRHDNKHTANQSANQSATHVSRPEKSRWEKLRWLTARLRAMSLSEIQHRLKTRSIKKQWKQNGAPLAVALPTLPDLERIANLPFYAVGLERDALRAAVGESEIVALLKEADEALEGRWRFFAFADDQSIPIPPDPSAIPPTGTFAGAQPIDWHRCDITGLRADPSAFGLDFDYKDFNVVGNVKYTPGRNPGTITRPFSRSLTPSLARTIMPAPPRIRSEAGSSRILPRTASTGPAASKSVCV